MSITDYQIPASKLYQAMRSEGINAVTTVPDLIQFALHDQFQQAEDIEYIECSAENQALTTAMGLYIGGMTPLVMMQNQGLFNCLNTLRSVGIDANIPLVLSVGAFGREIANLGKSPNDSSRVCLNKVEPVMAAMGIPYFHLETEEDLPQIAKAFATARAKKCAVVISIGYFPSWT